MSHITSYDSEGAPSAITCDCGTVHEWVPGQDIECVCGQWINSSGQNLKPPHQWEEDWHGQDEP